MDTASQRVSGPDSLPSAQSKDPDADTMSCSSETVSPIQSPVKEAIPLSPEVEAWNRLVKQTEELVLLDCLLKLHPERYRKRMDCEPVTVCVASLLDGGKGECLSPFEICTLVIFMEYVAYFFQNLICLN